MDSTPEQPKQKSGYDIKLRGWSPLSFLPWAISAKDNIQAPTTINKGLKRRAQSLKAGNSGSPLRFRPYVSKVPWHTGPRGFLSQLLRVELV